MPVTSVSGILSGTSPARDSDAALAMRLGTFGLVKLLIQGIGQFVAHDQQNGNPFAWTASPESFLE